MYIYMCVCNVYLYNRFAHIQDIYIYIIHMHMYIGHPGINFLILNLCQAVEAQVSRLPAGDFCSARGLLKALAKTLPDKKAEFAENQGSKDPQSLFSMET